VSDNDIILGLVALVLVVFSLVVSLLIPRRDPGFPGRNLRTFVVVAILLVVAMLATVELVGGEHESEAEGGGEAQATETGEGTGTGQTDTGGGGGQGDPAAGGEVFASSGCGSCHTLADAGTSAEIGPNLDEVLQGQDAAFIEESIVDPNAQVAEGFSEGIMPQDYGEQLSEQQLADLVAYLQQATGGLR
jgi:mono/diheme cytochrome c family protein